MKPRLHSLVALVILAMSIGAVGCEYVDEEVSPAPPTPRKERQPQLLEELGGAVERAHCPATLPRCRTARGRIVYVEAVDPDGDGDAHFVILDPQSITLPGLTAIDVRRGLRPHPLPDLGEMISAAGPVQTGTYAQRQIHAVELHVAGR